MRWFIALIAAFAIADLGSLTDRFREDPDLAPAVSIKCGHLRGPLASECHDDYREAFEAGEMSPELVARMHCTRHESVWEIGRAEAPPVCQERYGGWVN
jgi:hypothetical protein